MFNKIELMIVVCIFGLSVFYILTDGIRKHLNTDNTNNQENTETTKETNNKPKKKVNYKNTSSNNEEAVQEAEDFIDEVRVDKHNEVERRSIKPKSNTDSDVLTQGEDYNPDNSGKSAPVYRPEPEREPDMFSEERQQKIDGTNIPINNGQKIKSVVTTTTTATVYGDSEADIKLNHDNGKPDLSIHLDNKDKEDTAQVTCMYCGSRVPVSKGGSAVCPNCGGLVVDSSDDVDDELGDIGL